MTRRSQPSRSQGRPTTAGALAFTFVFLRDLRGKSLVCCVELRTHFQARGLILNDSMATTLDQIVAARRRSVESAKASADKRALERQAADHVPRGFRRGLESKAASGI